MVGGDGAATPGEVVGLRVRVRVSVRIYVDG